MRLLLVEDDPRVGELVKEALEAEGYAVDWAESAEEALGLLEAFPYDLAVLDVMLPGMDASPSSGAFGRGGAFPSLCLPPGGRWRTAWRAWKGERTTTW